ncbi:DUF3306 domain-containing protein [Jannaschia sp. S6380]|uniref:DUF3306 domain-containing protein n=1 Tax=Jannaschia sp. S6380 TaxID=2926408 RepID=UPI001FF19E20|nr:DUF3306 domain-containing protein [Jannaschia sp. S6380]
MSDFWARRKRAVEAAETAEARAREARAAEAEVAELADLPEAEILERLSLPDPDSVRSGDDVAAFLARAVPNHIRNRALRSLWRSNPILANLDGLNDYDGDFTGDGLNGGALRTSYEVGKGLAAHLRHLSEPNPAPDAEVVAEPEAPLGADVHDDAGEPISLARTPPAEDDRDTDGAAEEVAPAVVEALPRMRFTFEGD